MCSGRNPMPMSRAGMRRRIGNQSRQSKRERWCGAGPTSIGEMMRFCKKTCRRWVRIVGGSRRRCTARRSSGVTAPASEFRDQDVGGGDGILDREIYADAADRRHRMRRVADEQQSRPAPFRKAIDRDGQQFNVVPGLQFLDPVGEMRHQRHDRRPERRQTGGVRRLDAAFWDDIRALPVVAAVQRDHHPPGVDLAQ